MSVILVVDSHGVYRAGLRGIIEARLSRSRVIESPDFSSIEPDRVFDLILIDSHSLSYQTFDALAELHEVSPTTRVAVMMATKIRTDVLNYLSAGFHGVVHKMQPDEELLAAVDDLLSGRIYVPSWVADTRSDEPLFPPDIQQETLKLTPRQNEVLILLARGMSNKEIARKLDIAEGTSKIHTAALLRALGVRNRTEAAFMAAKLVASKEISAGGLKKKPNRIKEPTKHSF